MNESILIVDDEPGILQLVRMWLERVGYSNVRCVDTGREAIESARSHPPDCILLDLVLPDQSGIEVCRKLRSLPSLSRVPIVLFTAHKKEKVLGLQSGADYFVAKSPNPNELLATIQAVFRRRQMEEGTLQRGELTLKAQDRRVYWRGEIAATLTSKMFTLLHVLVERSPQPVSRDDLYRLVGGVENPGLSRALDVMLNRLRHALPEELGGKIVNVKNFGYVFLEPTSSSTSHGSPSSGSTPPGPRPPNSPEPA